MKSLSQSVDILINKVFSKRYSPAFAKIFTNWQVIVGQHLASVCVPIMIDRFDKVLIVEIYDKTRSIELHFMQEIVVTRINAILGQSNARTQIIKLVVRNAL